MKGLIQIAFGISLACAVRGQGTVVFVQPPQLIRTGGAGYGLDMNGDGTLDFRIQTDSSLQTAELFTLGSNTVAGYNTGGLDQTKFVAPLQAGALLGPSLAGGPSWVTDSNGLLLYLVTNVGDEGLWNGFNNDAYVGTQFYAAGQVHYGYVHLNLISFSARIVDWAYDTVPNEAVVVVPIPEPSTLGFALIGTLACVWASKTKRASV